MERSVADEVGLENTGCRGRVVGGIEVWRAPATPSNNATATTRTKLGASEPTILLGIVPPRLLAYLMRYVIFRKSMLPTRRTPQRRNPDAYSA
jgi:hypothetical protein